ncbi:MAG TPA: ligase-associated DNA damage response endonuclease PdeM, partial [Flavilitoribacter sp.]|nr:ligase-associated DNA damage response endonuclease PdeM [Flavilitoribacter sp.]
MTAPSTVHRVCGQSLHLHPLKAAWWEEGRTLFLADLHLGKGLHFRKAGIPAPKALAEANLNRLDQLLGTFEIDSVFFLGDLFHSDHNGEWAALGELLARHPKPAFHLVRGNHDILTAEHYGAAGISLLDEPFFCDPFVLTHYPLATPDPDYYNLAGHIHPAVILNGKGRQHLRLPCFHFGPAQAVLPAFGAFTGHACLTPNSEDAVFVIFEDRVLKIG